MTSDTLQLTSLTELCLSWSRTLSSFSRSFPRISLISPSMPALIVSSMSFSSDWSEFNTCFCKIMQRRPVTERNMMKQCVAIIGSYCLTWIASICQWLVFRIIHGLILDGWASFISCCDLNPTREKAQRDSQTENPIRVTWSDAECIAGALTIASA